jgi:hypothetical protein
MFSAQITVMCEKIQRGCTFTARFFDRDSSQFYGAQGDTPLEAVAWCLEEYIARVVYGLGPKMARNSDARPGDRFAGMTARPCVAGPTPATPRVADASAPSPERSDAKCFDRQIDRPAEPVLHGENKKSAATRRASAKKKSPK